jgi:glycosyltransferase involved in cell wall biosynthesis
MIPCLPNTRVSVVMCTYRGTVFLEAQLETLLTQTLQPVELIVSDDNSGDQTVSLVERFRQRAPFPVHLSVNSQQLGSTQNFDKALELATGDLLALCDQDDFWFPSKLATMARVFEDERIGGVFSDALLIDDNGSPVSSPSFGREKLTLWRKHGFNMKRQRRFAHGGAAAMLLQHDVVTGATLMVRRSLRSLWHPIPPTWVHDGWITWILALHSRIELVPEPLIAYRIHAQQQLGIGNSSRIEQIKALRRTERIRYAMVANQFEELYQRVQSASPPELLQALRQKIAFLERRAQMPRGVFRRVCWIMAALPQYLKYARGWRSIRKDLFLS